MNKTLLSFFGVWGLIAAVPAHAVHYPITEQQRSTAQQVKEAGVPLSELAPNAPDSYTIVRGDTLWAISGKFLKRPWRWPELWGMNLEEIRNPHLIYPGQVLYLDKSNGRARLRLGKKPTGMLKLRPQIRAEDLDSAAIPSIPPNIIEPFLTQALIMEEDGLKDAPRIVATQENRVFMSEGDLAYVRGIDNDNVTMFQSFRKGEPLFDPDGDGKTPLVYEARYAGSVQLTRMGDPATVRVVSNKEELSVGDRLVPMPPPALINYGPHPVSDDVKARIMSIYGSPGRQYGGVNQVVSINKGKNAGLEVGHVFSLARPGATVDDKTSDKREGWLKTDYPKVTLPDEPYGVVFVFRVFDKAAYGLVMEASHQVSVGDKLSAP